MNIHNIREQLDVLKGSSSVRGFGWLFYKAHLILVAGDTRGVHLLERTHSRGFGWRAAEGFLSSRRKAHMHPEGAHEGN